GFREIFDGSVVFIFIPVYESPVVISVIIFGIETNRFVKILYSPFVVAFLAVDETAVIVSIAIIDIYSNRLVEILKCTVIILLIGISIAPISVDFGEIFPRKMIRPDFQGMPLYR